MTFINKLPFSKLSAMLDLTRLNRPIGIFLLMWPTLTALWIATAGRPSAKLLSIFIGGVIIMRSAGCVINDIADRHLDGKVARTQHRPLVEKRLTLIEALLLFVGLCAIALLLVMQTNWLTIQLSLSAFLLACSYPFMKRFTHFPQLVLGAAFAFGIPMAFSAQAGAIPDSCWLLFIGSVTWTVAYDTIYALMDRDDDVQAGIKSTAILFGELDRGMIGMMQVITIASLWLAGQKFELTWPYFVGLGGMALTFVYQQWLIRHRQPQACLTAFINNAWSGAILYAATVMHFLL
jgi:4-hydroxybenzoate polyprenyltransferase